MTWLWIILAFAAGGLLGVIIMCCFVVAGDADKRLEKLDTENTDSR